MNKYKINEIIDKLSYRDYGRSIRCLAKELEISVNTVHNYRNIMIDDPQDIPHRIVVMMEQLFELEEGKLKNYKAEVKPLRLLIREGGY